MKVKPILIILNILGLVGTLIWLLVEQSWEPLVAVITGIGTLIALLYSGQDSSGGAKMKQTGGKNSTNYQAGGNMTINK
jgi:hypothetical protein